jgi:hypothetical protein
MELTEAIEIEVFDLYTVGDNLANANEIFDVLDRIELGYLRWIDVAELVVGEPFTSELSVVPRVQKTPAEVLLHWLRWNQVAELAIDRSAIDATPDDATVDVLIDLRTIHQRCREVREVRECRLT